MTRQLAQSAGYTVDHDKRLAAFMREVLQWAAPVNRETVDCPPMGMWSEVACLLEDWAPPQDWRQVEVTPKAVGEAFGIVSRYFEKQSAHEAAGTVGWLLLTVLKKSTEEKDMLLKKIQEMAA